MKYENSISIDVMYGASAVATETHVAHKQPRVARVRVVVARGGGVDGSVLEVGTSTD